MVMRIGIRGLPRPWTCPRRGRLGLGMMCWEALPQSPSHYSQCRPSFSSLRFEFEAQTDIGLLHIRCDDYETRRYISQSPARDANHLCGPSFWKRTSTPCYPSTPVVCGDVFKEARASSVPRNTNTPSQRPETRCSPSRVGRASIERGAEMKDIERVETELHEPQIFSFSL